jgi:hypothetical protein
MYMTVGNETEGYGTKVPQDARFQDARIHKEGYRTGGGRKVT